MKSSKIIWILLMVFLALWSFVGCNQSYNYSFAQSIENAEKVEICEYNDMTQKAMPISTLATEDANALLSDLQTMKCNRHFLDPTTSYGEVIIRITYIDGTAEIIGIFNVAQVNKNGEWNIGNEYFDAAQLCTLIMKYVDADLLPDLSKYFD